MVSFVEIKNFLELPCNVYMRDQDGIYRECNLLQAECLGATHVNDVLGKSDLQIHSAKEDCQIWSANDAEVLKSEKPKMFIEPLTFADKIINQMISYRIPCHDSQGNIIGVLGTSIAIEKLQSSLPIGLTLPVTTSPVQDTPNVKLSKREKECLDNLVCGMTAKEIARRLGLSPRTIEFYIENMKKKLGCNNRIQLIAKAYDILR